LAEGPKASIDRLLQGKARSQGVPERFEPTVLAEAALNSGRLGGDPGRLKASWVYRMFFGPDPLTERLALMWHNHFATSNLKVDDLAAMRRQNELFRSLARAPYGKLLDAAVRDPALLVWLDAQTNRKGHPNENLARELLELFTLGIGHYSEMDVKEAARALTGWTTSGREFREGSSDEHDSGEKTILGRKGHWRGGDLVRILLDHPATAERLAVRLCELFMGEGAPDGAAVKALAAGLRDRELDIGWAVQTILRSQGFFAEGNLGTRVQGPVEYVIGSARSLELFEPPPSTLALAEWAARLGQDLFYPPNVGGWPGGRSWISPQSMIARTNFAATLVGGGLSAGRHAPDVLALAKRHEHGGDIGAVIEFYCKLLQGSESVPAWRDRVLASVGPKATVSPELARRVVILILASPEAQLA
jgi:uncharacterized protein (DUF1800 family)